MSQEDASARKPPTPGAAKPDEGGQPVTVIRTRRAKRGREQEVEEVLAAMIQAASAFPGHKGAKILRPTNPERPDYQVVFMFDTSAHFDDWEKSETRKQWMERLEPLMEAQVRTHFLTGLETWFTLPVPSAGFMPPPPYKMAVATWLAIYPLVTVLLLLLTAIPVEDKSGLLAYVFGPPNSWPYRLLSPVVLTGILVPLMTYVVMPRVTYFLRRWLFARGPR